MNNNSASLSSPIECGVSTEKPQVSCLASETLSSSKPSSIPSSRASLKKSYIILKNQGHTISNNLVVFFMTMCSISTIRNNSLVLADIVNISSLENSARSSKRC